MPSIGRRGQPDPLHAAKECYGLALATNEREADMVIGGRVRTTFLQRAYEWYPDKDKFFNDFFEKIAGTKELRKQIIAGWSEEDIRNSWQKDIQAFKQIRKKYLLYKDFE